jgi:putative holliday junction resolvase
MTINNVLALDIGTVRIGVARANMIARLPEVLQTITNDETVADKLSDVIKQYEIDTLIVGLPRNMEGKTTKQTQYVKDFSETVLAKLQIPIVYQDETLTSVAAEQMLPSTASKADIDGTAAAIILQDYLEQL